MEHRVHGIEEKVNQALTIMKDTHNILADVQKIAMQTVLDRRSKPR